ncbi:UbiA family prenyltransferase [Fulvivirgaceae bacterium BMA10]|uniref:UbiA family prenyltransferase n=1 Tax=Splendidivirga corallicola TaxID=3051826 RepID=A0ABT8KPY9_9BACT|nr:UbiA family prenyltransferase [Fulvivirgaceae bacterium BMA10]
MISKSTLLHLRIPFSFFLLPVFLFALSVTPNLDPSRILIVFIALHLFLYPASNAYNSYFDKDEKSIGGLKNPPPVSKQLYWTSLAFDFIAIVLALFINISFAMMLLVYGLVSKAYSHPAIRLKKYPFASWFVAGFFQGCFTFLAAYMGLNDYGFFVILHEQTLIPGLLSSLLLWGSYPMTQIYQHEEDAKRGDGTLSILLGIKGTFYFTAIMFTLASLGFFLYFQKYFATMYGSHFLFFLSPVVLYFGFWFLKVLKNRSKADYGHTMWLNTLSALLMNAFFIYFFLDSTRVLDALKAGY